MTATAAFLDPQVVHGFIEAVVRCLRTTVGVDAAISVVREPDDVSQITIALDVEGDVRGPVTWVFPPEIALELVRRLLADPDPPADSANDGATELANILTGHATSVLEAHGFRCEIGVPKLHVGALPAGVNIHMATPKGPIDLVLSLSTDC